jgi:hypothetical protein
VLWSSAIGAAWRSNETKKARARSNGLGCHAVPSPPYAVRLQLHALAHNLGNFIRTLAMPKAAEAWSLTSLREKLIKNRRRGRQPRPLRHLPIGRGLGVAADVCGYPDAHRPTAGAARTNVTGKWSRIPETETAEVRFNRGETTSSSASARSIVRFGPSTRGARIKKFSGVKGCHGSSRARSWPQYPPESGECRINANVRQVTCA